jgi:uncharacterized membrane protein
MSSSLVVISFDSATEAENVLGELKSQSKFGNISLDDTAVVSKDADGKVHVRNNVSHGTMTATGIGALLGLLLSFIAFPVAGLLIGGALGAGVGRLVDLGIDGKFVKQVSEALEPGTSALFVLVHDANPAAIRAALEDHHGTIIQTTLSTDAEENLKKALG